MSRFEMLWFGIWGTLGLISCIYWGNLAWFHPDTLKKRLMKNAQRHPDWLFIKDYRLKFSDKYGVFLIRAVTLLFVLMIFAAGILVSVGILGIIK